MTDFAERKAGPMNSRSNIQSPAIHDYFSSDYFEARRRFIATAERHGFRHKALPVQADSPTGEPLTIDVASIGSSAPRSAIIVSSGVHGVEGFFGSAVQLAFLDQIADDRRPPEDGAIVLIHALNPFGFAWRRRFNEDNVDLNRNFLLTHESYTGSPPLTAAFRRVVAAGRPPARYSSSAARIAYLALRHGVNAFWETFPVGQYDYPDWLWFGGREPTQSARAVEAWLPPRLRDAQEVVHLDFHTGLGRWATYRLMLPELDVPENIAWWQAHFDPHHLEHAKGVRRYEVRGGLGAWLQARFPDCHYRFATAEFGTYAPFRVIRALVGELRWHTTGDLLPPDHWSRRRLTEAFAPRNAQWRTRTVRSGVELIDRAANAIW